MKVSCALAIALGTYLGGWRIIRTLGKGLVEISPSRAWRRRHPRAAAAWIWIASRRSPIDSHNVNAEWDGHLAPAPETAGAG